MHSVVAAMLATAPRRIPREGAETSPEDDDRTCLGDLTE